MERHIYIEKETLKNAQKNTAEAIQNAHKAIKDGTPDEIRAAINDILVKSRAQRDFVRANYNL